MSTREGAVLGTITTYKSSPGSGCLMGQSDLVAPVDPAAFWEGFCPNCRVPLGGSVLNWCPQCHAYWHAVPPGPACGQCGRTGAASRDVIGTSTLYSWPYDGAERYVCRGPCLETEG